MYVGIIIIHVQCFITNIHIFNKTHDQLNEQSSGIAVKTGLNMIHLNIALPGASSHSPYTRLLM